MTHLLKKIEKLIQSEIKEGMHKKTTRKRKTKRKSKTKVRYRYVYVD